MSDELDTTDIDRWLGVPLGRTGNKEPVHVNDIRRWAQAMHHPNPLYYDEDYASASRFGQIVAPQSFTVNCESGHGARPAMAGTIPNSHMLFGGDEWWFFGPRIFPEDRVFVDHVPFDYRRTTTSFAGPTIIQRGDNHYVKGDGSKVAIQRSSSVRYRPAAARESAGGGPQEEPEWSDADLTVVNDLKYSYASSIRELGHDPRLFKTVTSGTELPVRVIGPHSVISFATEWRAYSQNTWGAMFREEYVPNVDSGFTSEMSFDSELASRDPEFGDGAYFGPSRGHLNDRYARRIGMPRAYGYGASMGAWLLDYLSSYAGEWGLVQHSKIQYRGPALTGDVTYVRGTVTGTSDAIDPAHGVVHVAVEMTNQRDEVLAKATGDLALPRG